MCPGLQDAAPGARWLARLAQGGQLHEPSYLINHDPVEDRRDPPQTISCISYVSRLESKGKLRLSLTLCQPQARWNGELLMRMAISKEGWNSTLLPSDLTSSAHTVTFLTLDESLRDVDTQLIKLLKVDTEGYDGRVLRGSQRILQTGRPVVLFEHNRENLSDLGEDNLDVFENFRLCGYKAALFWEPEGRFMLGATLDDTALIDDLHHYVDRRGRPLGRVHYLDVCVFHEQDEDLAEKCLAGEREARDRRRTSGSPVRC